MSCITRKKMQSFDCCHRFEKIPVTRINYPCFVYLCQVSTFVLMYAYCKWCFIPTQMFSLFSQISPHVISTLVDIHLTPCMEIVFQDFKQWNKVDDAKLQNQESKSCTISAYWWWKCPSLPTLTSQATIFGWWMIYTLTLTSFI